ncbi:MAG: serine protease, partial [Ignavibacteriaceae bacterium]|nr:serine protease [Ignavibacteriaceae bacterium]
MFYRILAHLVLILILIFKFTFPQCSDNRTPSDYKAVCRINAHSGYGTGFILCDGRIATAGHVANDLASNSTIEFNIPSSGNVNASDIYKVDVSSIVIQFYNPTIEGEDWAVFSVFPNSITNQMPKDAQNAFLLIEQNNSFQDIYIVGYVNNDIQRESIGLTEAWTGERILFSAYATEGNSGAPLISSTDGKVIGIFTNIHCNTDGFNSGTSFFNSSLWAETNTNLTADNNIIAPDNSHGLIIVDNSSRVAPLTFSKNKGELVTFQAIRQNDKDNYIRDWNNSVISPNNWSEWTRTKTGEAQSHKGHDNPLPFSLTPDDYNSTYTANLRRKFQITHTCITEFNGLEYIPSGEIFEGNDGIVSGYWNAYLLPLTFTGWIDDFNAPLLRVISPTANSNYSSLNKAINHSNSSTGFQSNSQRKVLRTPDGTIHLVYESMGYVWYERSTDNGVSWTIANGSRPLSINEAKLPSIDSYNLGMVGIVFQERNLETSLYNIRLDLFNNDGTIYFNTIVQGNPNYNISSNDPYLFDSNPVIALSDGNGVIVAWSEDGWGIRYQGGFINLPCTAPNWIETPTNLPYIINTYLNSSNPTIAVAKGGQNFIFHLAWQQNATAINYCTLTPTFNYPNYSIVTTPVETPSSGSSKPYNYNPQIAVNYLGDAYLTWIGAYNSGNGWSTIVNRAKSGGSWSSAFNTYGNNAASPTLQFVNGSSDYIISWSEGNGSSNKFCRSDYPGGILDYGILGSSIQVVNGNSLDAMQSISFNNFSLPYYFKMTHNSVIPKTLNLTALIEAMYVAGGTQMTMAPTVIVELHNSISPYVLVESDTAT